MQNQIDDALWRDSGPLFMVFEGIDGTGKSSQVQLLVDYLQEAGRSVRKSREPSDGPAGRRLRAAMFLQRLSPREELDLFIADRKEHIKEVIRPSLDAGCSVVLDRYFYSTVAYQGAGGNFAPVYLEAEMLSFAPVPDLVFLLDMFPQDAIDRIAAGRDTPLSQYEQVGFLTKCQRIFLEMASRRPEIRIIDARLHPDEVFSTVIRHIAEHLSRKQNSQENDVQSKSGRSNQASSGAA